MAGWRAREQASSKTLVGCDLRLMSSVKDVSAIPTAGKRLVIVAAVDHVLHFRIFDSEGKMVVDTDATQRMAHAQQIEDLREQLANLWPPHELTTSEKGRVIGAVTSIVGHTPLVLILDQVEEAFTRPLKDTTPAKELAALAGAVRGLGLAAERPRGKLILGFRKDWLQEVEQALTAVAVTEEMIAKVPLDPMDGKDIRESVAGPAREPDLRDIHLEIDDDLPGEIADDLLSDSDARAAIAPTLQVILSQLWDQVKDRSPRRYTVELYRALRGEGLLLGDFLETQLKALKTSHSTEVEKGFDFEILVEKGFDLEILEAHTTAWGTANRRSRRSLTRQFPDQAGCLPGLLQRFKDLYLLIDPPPDPAEVKDSRVAPDPETSLAHDALAPLVQKRHRESSAPAQLARRILNSLAARSVSDRGPALLNEAQLALVDAGLSWIQRPNDQERHMIKSSRDAVAEQKVREQSMARLRNRLGIVAGVGLLFASIAAVAFWYQRGVARYQRGVAVKANNETKAVNEQLAKNVKETKLANEKLKEAVKIADTEKKKAEHEARLALVRLQHSTLSEVGSLAKTDPLRGRATLYDSQVFPAQDRDFAWGYHLGLCDWVRTIDAHQGGVSCLAYGTAGLMLVTGGRDGMLRFWVAATCEPAGQPIEAHKGAVSCVAFSRDGLTLATGGMDGKLRFWDAASRQPKGQPVDAHVGGVMCLAYSVDGRTLASGGRDGKLRLWDAVGKLKGRPIDAHGGVDGVLCLTYSPDGRTLATGGFDGKVCLWDAEISKQHVQPIHEPIGSIRCLAYSPNGRTLVAGSYGGVLRLWDAETGKPKGQPDNPHYGYVLCLAYSPDGRTLATGGAEGRLQLWDADTIKRRGDPIAAHEEGITCMAYSVDGRTLATGGGEGKARLWNPESEKPLTRHIHQFGGTVTCLGYSPKGNILAMGDSRGYLRLWDAITNKLRPQPRIVETGAVVCLAYSPDGGTLAIAGDDKKVRLWDPETFEPRKAPSLALDDTVWCIAFSDDGRTLAAGGRNGDLRLLVEGAIKPQIQYDAHEGGVMSLAFGKNGRTLVTGGADGKVRLWDAKTVRRAVDPIDAHEGGVFCLAYSNDRRNLITGGGRDGKLQMWDAETMGRRGGPIDAHRGGVLCLAISVDGRTMATGGRDGKIRLWEAATGQPRGQPIVAHEGNVTCLAYSKDGRALSTGGSDGTIRFWMAVFSSKNPETGVLTWLSED
jgi:WD40 repeat protein